MKKRLITRHHCWAAASCIDYYITTQRAAAAGRPKNVIRAYITRNSTNDDE